VDFLSVWSSLGPVYKYFSEAKSPTIILPGVQGINELGNYFPTVKPVDRVHGTVDRWCTQVHGGPRAARTGGR
jgi:hypothetical protein